MTLAEIYYNAIFNGKMALEDPYLVEPYNGENIKNVQIRVAATYFCYSLYLINKAYSKSWSIKHFEGVAEDIVLRALGIKKRPYKFKVVENEYYIRTQEILLRESSYMWVLGYKFLEVGADFHWYSYWREQIGRYQSENE